MPTYPLATLGCTVTSAGITAPPYSDILASLQASARLIFGNDIYLESDSQDGQMLAIYAKAINDSNNNTIAAYNARSPLYAQGNELYTLLQVNGVKIDPATHSTCPVVLTGVAGTVVVSGVVGDTAGNLWDLPASVTIGIGGTVTVTATARDAGALTSAIGTLTVIQTPTRGWQSVTNTVAGVLGEPVISDAQARQKQAQSVAAPSTSVAGGIQAGVLNVAGVTAAKVYDNDTGATDGNGIPAHTIAVVVGGGAVQDVVNAIGVRKTPGTGTQGNTTGTYVDPVGIADVINYWALAEIQAQVTVNIHALAGFTSATADKVSASVAGFINTLLIGQTVALSKLYSPANLTGAAAEAATGLSLAELTALSDTYTVSSILICAFPGTPIASDLAIAFNQQAKCLLANVTVNVS